MLAPLYDSQGIRQLDANGEPAWQVVDAMVGNDDVAHEVFYYSAGVDDLQSIQAPLPGLSIIAGTASTLPGVPQPTTVARWHCQSWQASDASNPDFRGYIPECVAPDRLCFDLFFPSCWNGVDLDAPDHKSHMAYPETVAGVTHCPASHPVALPRVSYHYAFAVRPENYHPTTRSSRGWRLAADAYTVTDQSPGGYSLHGDWINGWHVEAMQALIDHCIKAGKDCHDGNLAMGFRLTGTAPGIQQAQPIINEGRGATHDADHIFAAGFEGDSDTVGQAGARQAAFDTLDDVLTDAGKVEWRQSGHAPSIAGGDAAGHRSKDVRTVGIRRAESQEVNLTPPSG